MTTLSDEDWERVNAFHDGALTPPEAQAFDQRLAAEPALAAALAEVAGLSRSLAVLRPAIVAEPVSPPPPTALPTRRWWIGGALAACLALAVGLALPQRGPASLLDIHHAYLAQEFDVTRSAAFYVGTTPSAVQPDLTGGNLTPVALRTIPDGTVAHYAGRNGCRLSYFRGKGTLGLPAQAAVQASVWTTRDGVQHALVASGMDVPKFDAIASYLHQVTRQRAIDHLYAAMTDATRNASPCVG
ncbi:hypothetical protein KUD11_12945 [Roseovarius sp. LXJ103]|uniref:hypothetical protein n=1 Tax=Roseovarius carneus TaxID=2853164 RepID=UPI000D606472|nr:hypothetical protein [Roseovarius carneus]MBZ8119550.1 hypothetical protein [Roseovarius carneus]PWE34825.1 hypothetical protein DD563_01805 [Pelagicola sp. LXJ1103]